MAGRILSQRQFQGRMPHRESVSGNGRSQSKIQEEAGQGLCNHEKVAELFRRYQGHYAVVLLWQQNYVAWVCRVDVKDSYALFIRINLL